MMGDNCNRDSLHEDDSPHKYDTVLLQFMANCPRNPHKHKMCCLKKNILVYLIPIIW